MRPSLDDFVSFLQCKGREKGSVKSARLEIPQMNYISSCGCLHIQFFAQTFHLAFSWCPEEGVYDVLLPFFGTSTVH